MLHDVRSSQTNRKENHQERHLPIEKAWAISADEVIDKLQTDPKNGLTWGEAATRLKRYGENKLRKQKKRSILRIFADQFKSLIIALLFAAAVVSLWFGELLDFWAIMAVIVISTLIGFFTELRAVRSMEALYRLGRVKTRVIRDGATTEEDALTLVPGDIIVVEGGDVITADLRILECSILLADESSLTGESTPVEKSEKVLNSETVLAERSNMLYKGTAVTRGSATAVVVSTGMDTELGTITELVHEAEDEQTPLEERLDKLGNRLIWVTLAITVAIVLTGLLTGRELLLLIQTGVALAVATIPEGLPIVATIALAKGVKEMAERNAIITKISSVETLGSTQVIFTDKTGTLTENRMAVTHYLIPGGEEGIEEIETAAFLEKQGAAYGNQPLLRSVLETGVLCNNATVHDHENMKGTGDPLEVALLASAEAFGMDTEMFRVENSRKKESAFNPEQKMMAVWNLMKGDGASGVLRISVKGAPGAVLEVCDHFMEYDHKNSEPKMIPLDENGREKWKDLNRRMAAKGLRLLALAYKDEEGIEPVSDPYTNLIFTGLVALLDPPRKDVRDAIETCKKAGIHVVMVTGDQLETARYIAGETGLEPDRDKPAIHGLEVKSAMDSGDEQFLNTTVFARVSPGQKLDLIDHYQNMGMVVAMTGDGVNDAPALKKADIGIAMGKRGSQVAREASDMVLTDDAFSSIVVAIEQGRIIFSNIRKFIYYLMSCNISEVMVVAFSFVTLMPLPVLPLQILFLNLVTDVFPALALGVGRGERNLMNKPPRKPDESILTRSHWIFIGIYGLVITLSVLTVLWIGLNVLHIPSGEAVTLSFLTLAFSQLWHVFNMRSIDSAMFDNTITRNPFVWGALMLSSAMLLAAIYIPGIAEALSVYPPSFIEWILVLGFSMVPLVLGQTYLVLAGMRRRKN
jgi:P-type Ca2+ transporter type 2C